MLARNLSDAPLLRNSDLLRATIEKFGIKQKSICDRTLFLSQRYPSDFVYVAPDQLNRYLRKQGRDVMGVTLASLEAALPPAASLYYQSLVALSRSKVQQVIEQEFAGWLSA